ncbi:MAG: transcriptional repressor [Patescibacteria group bacterium]|nr:MAG: transcriptional repressor [Patescibacteria group bacterium]
MTVTNNKSSAEIIHELSERGYKKTKVRQELIGYLNKLKKPIDAVELLVYLKKKGIEVNKTTVYRELNFLLKQGVIVDIYFDDDKTYYEIAGLPHHHHLVCRSCKIVEDVYAEGDVCLLEKKIMKETNFVIEKHSLEFFGLCRLCQKSCA